MRGVFCLEGAWDPAALHKGQTVQPILELLAKDKRVPYVHRDCATRSDVVYYLEQFTLKRYDRFPILYFAFHGTPGNVLLCDGAMSLDEIEAHLYHQARGCVIVFGTCSTLGVGKRRITQFLSATQAIAVCGYTKDVDWIPSTALELLLMYQLTGAKFTNAGMNAVRMTMCRVGRTIPDVSFRMYHKWEVERG